MDNNEGGGYHHFISDRERSSFELNIETAMNKLEATEALRDHSISKEEFFEEFPHLVILVDGLPDEPDAPDLPD